MFLSRVQIGSYQVGYIRVGFFWVRVFSGRFLSVPVLSGKKILDSKGTYKFSVQFRIGYFQAGSGLNLRIQVKMPRPTENNQNTINPTHEQTSDVTTY